MRQNAALRILVVGLGVLVGPAPVLAQRPLGIDVSNWQRTIDWTSVKGAGIAFAWAKASEGVTYTDPYFTNNALNAKAAGVLLGAYHFAHPDTHLGAAGADAEAASFWSVISNYTIADGLTLMPVLDYETAPGTNYTKTTSSEWVNRWCQDIVNYGRSNGVALTPVIYCTHTFANSWLDSTVTQWPLWIRNFNGQNPQTGGPGNISPWSAWAAWQYGHAPIPGITTGDADRDVFNGTLATLVSTLVVGPMSQRLAPNLSITASSGQVVLHWPLAGGNDFYLQTSTNLSGRPAWRNATDPATNGTELVVTNAMTNPSAFYRLAAWEYLFDGTNTAAFGAGSAFPSNSWFLTNGTLASKVVSSPRDLVTVNTYTNFELRLLWKCATNGNSGVFYREATCPEYQLFDDADVATSHYTDNTYLNPANLMGAVYGFIAPTNKHLAPTGEWNECRITVEGYHATHGLNGNVIVDYQINDPAYASSLTQATNTHIAFQNKGTGDHGVVPGVVYYKCIKIRPLP